MNKKRTIFSNILSKTNDIEYIKISDDRNHGAVNLNRNHMVFVAFSISTNKFLHPL